MPPEVHYVHHGETQIDIGPHVFPIEKYALLARWISELGIPAERLHGPNEVGDDELGDDELGDDDLLRVHSPEYVADLRAARRTWRTAGSELPVEAPLLDGFLAMAGGSITAMRLALDHGLGFHVGGGFHHAFRDHAEGFCYVNDAPIGIERMRAERGLGRALVVDVDVHQGNGTAAIYAGRADTFTYSIHQEHNYPIKERSDLDRGLEDGTDDAAYLELLAEDLKRIDSDFAPELVVYLAGVDPFEHDQLGGLALTEAGLEARDRLVLERYVARGVPVAVLLAGGYARTPEETALLHMGTVRAAEAACGG